MDINNNYQTTLINPPTHPNQQQNGFLLPNSYGNIPHYNQNYPYDPHLIQNQQNAYFNNYYICYKCNNVIYFNSEQFFKCNSCNRLCCIACIRTSSISSNTCYYQCEYCSLNTAINITRSQEYVNF
jgi:hypothetical protein